MRHISFIADPTADLATPLKGPFEPYAKTFPTPRRLGEARQACRPLAGGDRRQPAPGAIPSPSRARRSFLRKGCGRESETGDARAPAAGRGGANRTRRLSRRRRRPGEFRDSHRPPADAGPCLRGCIRNASPAICWARSNAIAVSNCAARAGHLQGRRRLYCFISRKRAAASLINKLRAYKLQDQGFDTLEANERLGFEAGRAALCHRREDAGAAGYNSVRLLTNNPDKVAGLRAAGVRGDVRAVRHAFPPTCITAPIFKPRQKKRDISFSRQFLPSG